MLADPRKGVVWSFVLAGAAARWLIALAFDADALETLVGGALHPITFLAFFAMLAALVTGLMLRRFAQVRGDLLEGRDLIARWSVDEKAFLAFAPKAVADDADQKRLALMLVFGFVAVIFGGVAVYDPDVAVPMLAAAAALCLVVTLAWAIGARVTARHWRWRGGEALIGRRGLMFNGVLHVWAAPLSWLESARLLGDPPRLRVSYAYWNPRAGPQRVDVEIPVPAPARAEARRAAAALAKS